MIPNRLGMETDFGKGQIIALGIQVGADRREVKRRRAGRSDIHRRLPFRQQYRCRDAYHYHHRPDDDQHSALILIHDGPPWELHETSKLAHCREVEIPLAEEFTYTRGHALRLSVHVTDTTAALARESSLLGFGILLVLSSRKPEKKMDGMLFFIYDT